MRPAVRVTGVSVVIPAYNEARRIGASIVAIVSFLESSRIPYELIVVDDGSTDRTVSVVEDLELPALRILRLERNLGKGAAVRTGMLAARHEWVLMTDADLSTPVEEFFRLRQALEAGADIAIASRALPSSQVEVHQRASRERAGRLFNGLVRLTLLPDLHDTQCGFKLFTRAAATHAFARARLAGFSFDVEVLFLARRAHLTVVEVPVVWRNDPSTRVSLAAGLRAFADVLRIRAWELAGVYDKPTP